MSRKVNNLSDQEKKAKTPKGVFGHIWKYILRGFFAVIPILFCCFAIILLYNLIDKKVINFISQFIDIRHIPGLGIILVLILLYLVGLTASNFLGKQFLKMLEHLIERIPLINTVYGIGKQISHSLSIGDKEKQAFKKAVLVKLDSTGLMVPGFLMNTIVTKDKEEFHFVLIPTAPTPASGFVCVVTAAQLIEPDWSVEECLKALLSVGIIVPKAMQLSKLKSIE